MPVLLPNGNIIVPRRAESDDGVVGLGGEEIGPESEDYARALRFLDAKDRKRAEAFIEKAKQKAA